MKLFCSCCKKWGLSARRAISIEPVMALYVWSSLVCHSALNKLEKEKACRANLKFNDTFCDRLLNGEFSNSTEAAEIQALLHRLHQWQNHLETFIPLILISILGAVSDKFQIRKPFLVFTIIGELLALVGCILSVVFMKEWRVEVEGVLQIVVPAFFGGPEMGLSLAYAYISDYSSIESRTFRIGMLQAVIYGCILISEYVGAILVTRWTYFEIFLLTGVSIMMTIALTIFWLYEKEDMRIVFNKPAITNTLNPKNLFQTLSFIGKNFYTRAALVVAMGFFIDIVYSMVLAGKSKTIFTSHSIGKAHTVG